MSRFDDEPDVELTGRLVDNGTGKAFHFAPDFGEHDDIWVPRSQADWIPDPDGDGNGTMMVRAYALSGPRDLPQSDLIDDLVVWRDYRRVGVYP